MAHAPSWTSCRTRATSTSPVPGTWWRATGTILSPPRPSSSSPTRTAVRDDEPVVVPIEDAIDLHAFAPREIPSVVESYLEAAHAAGFREVRLIHGRGRGVQRARVQQVLAAHPLVERFRDAPAERGGVGATLAWLRRG